MRDIQPMMRYSASMARPRTIEELRRRSRDARIAAEQQAALLAKAANAAPSMPIRTRVVVGLPEAAPPAVALRMLPCVYVLACRSDPELCKVGRTGTWADAFGRAKHYSLAHGLDLYPVATVPVRDKRAAIRLESDAHAYLRHLRVPHGGAQELFRFAPQAAETLLRVRAAELGLALPPA